MNSKYEINRWKSILVSTLIAGTLDIFAAFINAYISANIWPDMVLKYIASGVFGNDAYEGGGKMVLFGLIFHFTIALTCAVIFYFVYSKLSLLRNNVILNAFLIGVVAWIVTTHIVIPMSQIPPPSFTLSKALTSILILVICIGIPIAYRAKQFYKRQYSKL